MGFPSNIGDLMFALAAITSMVLGFLVLVIGGLGVSIDRYLDAIVFISFMIGSILTIILCGASCCQRGD